MTRGFFLNPAVIQEIVLWREHTGENLQVFEPISRACASLGSLLLPAESDRAAQVSLVLANWCASPDFENLLTEAGKARASISMALGRESLSRISGSASFVAGVPIDEVLSGFSALIRADLRARESRSSARIDEILLWQACFRRFSLHDLTLLTLAALASKDVVSTFDRLLVIKEDPGTLTQIDAGSLSTELSPLFTSGMRLFALSNFEAAEIAWGQAINKDPQSPSVYLAMSLLHIINGKIAEAGLLVAEAEKRSDSCLVAGIKHLLAILCGQEAPELWADDPVSVALATFFLLKERQYAHVIAIAQERLQTFPRDLVMQSLVIEAFLLPIRDSLFNDPPLPGSLAAEQKSRLDEVRIRLTALSELANTMNLSALRQRASTNLSCVALAQRDFRAAAEHARFTLAGNPSCGAAKVNLAITMLAGGDLPRALRALNSLPADLRLTGKRLAAEAHYHACAFESAIDIWKRILSEEADRLWQLRTLCRMLEVYRLLHDARQAQTCVDTLLSEFQHEPETLFALGYELWQMSRIDDAIHALGRAKDLAGPNLRNWVAWELGRVLFDAGKTLAATDEYVSIVDKNADSVQAREFAVTLFRAGLLPAACERARAIREAHGEVVPGITEIETDYLVRKEKYREAKELLRALARLRPFSVLNRLAVVRICMQLNEEEEARQELDSIRRLALTDEMQKEVERFSNDLDLVIAARSRQDN